MNTLQNFFDKIFVINLHRRPDRWSDCVKELEAHGIPKEAVTRFDAFDHPTSGHEGCTRSHRMLLRQIADSDWEQVLILEDDFQVITTDVLRESGFKHDNPVWQTFMSIPCGNNLNTRFQYLSRFLPPKWDVIYLGGGYGEPPISRVNEYVIRCGFMQTTSSYGITREFARVWTDKIDASMGDSDLQKHPGPIDNVFGSLSHDHNFYVFQPRMIFQRKSPSDITGENNSYLYSMTDTTHEKIV